MQPDPSQAPGRLRCTAPYPSASLPASQLPNSRWALDQLVQFWAAPGSQGGKLGLVGSVPLGLSWLWEYQAGPTELPLGRKGQLPVVSSQSLAQEGT